MYKYAFDVIHTGDLRKYGLDVERYRYGFPHASVTRGEGIKLVPSLTMNTVQRAGTSRGL